MNISKAEQRTLHALARGGAIYVLRDDGGKAIGINCITREGWTLKDCTLSVFKKLRKRRLISSRRGAPYEVTRLGRQSVRSQIDNRA